MFISSSIMCDYMYTGEKRNELDGKMNLEGSLFAAETFGTPHEVGKTAK